MCKDSFFDAFQIFDGRFFRKLNVSIFILTFILLLDSHFSIYSNIIKKSRKTVRVSGFLFVCVALYQKRAETAFQSTKSHKAAT